MGNVPSSVKLMELNPQSERLVPVGFFDSPTCVVSISVVLGVTELLDRTPSLARNISCSVYCRKATAWPGEY